MKGIEIFQHGNHIPVFLYDDNDDDLSKYTKEVSEILDVDTVIIFETTSGSTILRPNKISVIRVTNIEEKDIKIAVNTEENCITEESEDVITDGD
jgi:hypothetical protein